MKVLVFGDWHGNTEWASYALNTLLPQHTPDLILHVGDFGIWPNSDFLYMVEDILSSFNTHMWFIDGNHEYFPYITQYDSKYDGQVTPHIRHIKRGTLHTLGNSVVGFLGGAVSIDKFWRTPGVDYFEDERITLEDVKPLINIPDMDVLISHEAPELPPGAPSLPASTWVLEESAECRQLVSTVLRTSRPTLNIHGHHHKRYTSHHHNTRVEGLSRDGSTLEGNYLVLEL